MEGFPVANPQLLCSLLETPPHNDSLPRWQKRPWRRNKSAGCEAPGPALSPQMLFSVSLHSIQTLPWQSQAPPAPTPTDPALPGPRGLPEGPLEVCAAPRLSLGARGWAPVVHLLCTLG